ncbi:MAG: hypothetical protein MZU97_22620 [Bacillus subtilis]|nr:hypothetical protein [Bacillus subtilis]
MEYKVVPVKFARLGKAVLFREPRICPSRKTTASSSKPFADSNSGYAATDPKIIGEDGSRQPAQADRPHRHRSRCIKHYQAHKTRRTGSRCPNALESCAKAIST